MSFQSISIQNQTSWTRSWGYFHCVSTTQHPTNFSLAPNDFKPTLPAYLLTISILLTFKWIQTCSQVESLYFINMILVVHSVIQGSSISIASLVFASDFYLCLFNFLRHSVFCQRTGIRATTAKGNPSSTLSITVAGKPLFLNWLKYSLSCSRPNVSGDLQSRPLWKFNHCLGGTVTWISLLFKAPRRSYEGMHIF